MTKGKIWFALAVLFGINLLNFYDRLIPGAVGEEIRKEWGLSDTDLGWLATAFIILYALIGVPLGRWADKSKRTRILTIGVSTWSVLTAASGLAGNFWQMACLRLSVGVGEASCAPAANSMIGDLFPAKTRARALSLFMLGLPIGNALAYIFSGMLARAFTWRAAFYAALIPGLLCGLGAMFIKEPKRGGTEDHDIGAKKREGNPYLLVLSIPTMLWLIPSGALHNFSMYAIGSFLAPFMTRVHGTDVAMAGYISSFVYGFAGIPGMLLGGLLGDAMIHRRRNGRLLVAATALAISVPCLFLAIGMAQWLTFSILFGFGCMMLYVYYATVYSTIQDVIEPSLRATAMAIYFCFMYLFGGAFGPPITGILSDHFTSRAALTAGVSVEGLDKPARQKALEPFKAEGIQTAMYVLPIVSLLLAGTLFGASRTVVRDSEKLQRWMRESAAGEPPKAKLETIAS
ncbi:MAG TPA: MFS transporter [Pirellulales bacterium]|jgi:MFS family permease|nr:MFS transporter [Pirellulales bacterium]